MTTIQDIPVAHTPPGGYGTVMPPPVLAGCTDPLVAGAPDLRGTWRVVDLRIGDEVAPADHPVLRPERLPDVEVRRWREGNGLVWAYHTAFTAWTERVE